LLYTIKYIEEKEMLSFYTFIEIHKFQFASINMIRLRDLLVCR
jgi:hypothetical protein